MEPAGGRSRSRDRDRGGGNRSGNNDRDRGGGNDRYDRGGEVRDRGGEDKRDWGGKYGNGGRRADAGQRGGDGGGRYGDGGRRADAGQRGGDGGGRYGDGAGRSEGRSARNNPPSSSTPLPLVASPPVNRDKTCPMLVRCFWGKERHRVPREFAQLFGQKLPAETNEVQIHTWPDATLAEIAGLVQSLDGTAGALASAPGACMSFALVFPDRAGGFQLREVGRVVAAPEPEDSKDRAARTDDDGARSLASLRFVAGDYLDIAILVGPQQHHGKGPRGGGGKGFKGGGGKGRGKGGWGKGEDGGGWRDRDMDMGKGGGMSMGKGSWRR